MTLVNMSDVHAPHVQALVDAEDWAGLARYWMAHRHNPALDQAIDLVRCVRRHKVMVVEMAWLGAASCSKRR